MLTPTTAASGPLVLTCMVPQMIAEPFVDETIRWEWEEIAPDNTVERILPNVTGATCEF